MFCRLCISITMVVGLNLHGKPVVNRYDNWTPTTHKARSAKISMTLAAYRLSSTNFQYTPAHSSTCSSAFNI
ncbi:hypothetical protein BKA56DRAFT_567127 [Ilyonectria sp. MPI-CAGE-AT-0026]|nr:hypothetical protein BKA56DRAFT_567127 [Ilyonectria sp. MPI-CAGE-AT-0026]